MESIHPMWAKYPELEKELIVVRQLMIDSVQLEDEEIRQAILELLTQGGKMVRPAYLLLFSQWNGNAKIERVRAVAAALELLHVATLLHDDVIDDAEMRRGEATINAKYGNRVAIYAGDYLLTICYRLLSRYVEDLQQIEIPTNGMSRVIDGELAQMRHRYHYELGLQEYLKRIEGKTAQLFMMSCHIGAQLGGVDDALRAKKIGQQIGMAFQILDDVLDYEVDETAFGKPVLEDVAQGIYTAPLLYALEAKPKKIQPYLEKKEQLSQKDRSILKQFVHQFGGVDRAMELAKRYTDQALAQIEQLPESAQKQVLTQLTEELLKRTM